MQFDTSSFATGQVCSCTLGSVDACYIDGRRMSDDCLIGDDFRASISFVDNRILSCERGYIASTIVDNYNFTYPTYYIIRNFSRNYVYAAVMKYSIAQWNVYANDYLQGNIALICKYGTISKRITHT